MRRSDRVWSSSSRAPPACRVLRSTASGPEPPSATRLRRIAKLWVRAYSPGAVLSTGSGVIAFGYCAQLLLRSERERYGSRRADAECPVDRRGPVELVRAVLTRYGHDVAAAAMVSDRVVEAGVDHRHARNQTLILRIDFARPGRQHLTIEGESLDEPRPVARSEAAAEDRRVLRPQTVDRRVVRGLISAPDLAAGGDAQLTAKVEVDLRFKSGKRVGSVERKDVRNRIGRRVGERDEEVRKAC